MYKKKKIYIYTYIYTKDVQGPEQNRRGGMTTEQTDHLKLGTPITANRTRPDRTGRGAERNGPTLGGTAAYLDWTGPDRTGPHWTGPDETGPDQTAHDTTGPDQTGPHRTEQDPTRLGGTDEIG